MVTIDSFGRVIVEYWYYFGVEKKAITSCSYLVVWRRSVFWFGLKPKGKIFKTIVVWSRRGMLAEVCRNLVLSEEDCNIKTNGCNLSLILIYATIDRFPTCFVILHIHVLMLLYSLSRLNCNLSIIMFVFYCCLLVWGTWRRKWEITGASERRLHQTL